MAIPVYLQKFKAAGIYQVVFDKSIINEVDSEVLRLVVGYSEKGPFNTPVYIRSVSEFTATFGKISRKLEKRGVFFHRMAIQALSSGPILALNLKCFSNEHVGAIGFTPSTCDKNFAATSSKGAVMLEDIYDTSRFWKLDDKQLSDIYLTKSNSENIERGTNKLNGYVRIVSTDTDSTSNTLVFRKTVDPAILKSYDVTVHDWYATENTEMPEYFEGHEDIKISDFLVDVYVFRGKFTKSVITDSSLGAYIKSAPDADKYEAEVDQITFAPYIENAFGDKLDTLDQLYFDDRSGAIAKYTAFTLPYFTDKTGNFQSLDILFNMDNNIHNMMMYFDVTSLETEENYIEKLIVPENEVITGAPDETIYNEKLNALYSALADKLALTDRTTSKDDMSAFINKVYTLAAVADNEVIKAAKTEYELAEEADKDTKLGEWYQAVITLPDVDGNASDSKEAQEKLYNDIDNFNDAISDSNVVTAKAGYDTAKADYDAAMADYDAANLPYLDYPTVYLKGYTYANPMPTNTSKEPSILDADCNKWIKEYILNAIVEYKGLRTGLCTKAEVGYRYIIDTFKSYVDVSCKAILSNLAKERQNAFAILNFPAVETFKKYSQSGKQVFLDSTSKQFDVNKVTNQPTIFSLPSDAEGASFCAFYTPLKFNDSGTPVIVPAAALVSNNFMQKYTTRQPYYIVAGQNYGLMNYNGLVGPDYNWSRDELQIIEPFGVNCMMYRPRVGTFINANQTAKQTPKSALSLVNVRELVIYLQDEIEKVLQYYHWEINSADIRAKILDKANYICEKVRNNNGLYNYINIMDETNNDADIIDNEMAVLSTHIEPGKGCGKMIHSMTIHRTGGMTAALTEL